ncbi:NAD(P)/FAD-dependent oxidoreductase [Candidatus Poribacteria bacterium]
MDSEEGRELFLIIGAGAAGNAAAETLRRDGFQGQIIMMTREICLPYDRTKLSKSYLKSDRPTPPILRSEEFYNENNIEVRTGCEVINVDVSSKTVICYDGSELSFDKLLVATGGAPRCLTIPGFNLQNIFTLRYLDDADRIRIAAEGLSRAVVIGASFIAMELAATLSELGLSVTVVALESVPFEHNLGVEIGYVFQELHEENGVSFRLGAEVTHFEGNGRVQKAVLKDGEVLETDIVLQGIGTKPATNFLTGVELDPNGSVTVDKHLRVMEDIYAAGDIANFVDWRTGEHIRAGHWRLAAEQGRVAAHNMVGKEEEFRSISLFWTTQFDFSLLYVGHVTDWDEIIFHGDLSQRDFAAFYVKHNKVLAAAGGGDSFKTSDVFKLMSIDKMPTPDQLRNGPIDLAQWSKSGSVA